MSFQAISKIAPSRRKTRECDFRDYKEGGEERFTESHAAYGLDEVTMGS